jgi:hypothetical protein
MADRHHPAAIASAQFATWHDIAEHLGEDAVAFLRARILPKTRRSLEIAPSYYDPMQVQNLRSHGIFRSPIDDIQ